MKKLKATITSLATLTALSCIGAAVVCAQNSAPISVKADTPNTQLIAPQSYQQYLPLIAPTAVSVTSGCTAIADGKNIYLYEGEILDGTTTVKYRVYTHDNPITQLAFDEDGNLYFLSKLKLYTLSAADLQNPIEATKINDIACRNFTIHGQTLYYYATAETVLSRYSLADHTEQEDLPLPTQLRDGTPLTIIENTLYYMGESADGYAVYAVTITTGSSDAIATFSQPSQSVLEIRLGFIPSTAVISISGLFTVFFIYSSAVSIVSIGLRRRFESIVAFGGITFAARLPLI